MHGASADGDAAMASVERKRKKTKKIATEIGYVASVAFAGRAFRFLKTRRGGLKAV